MVEASSASHIPDVKCDVAIVWCSHKCVILVKRSVIRPMSVIVINDFCVSNPATPIRGTRTAASIMHARLTCINYNLSSAPCWTYMHVCDENIESNTHFQLRSPFCHDWTVFYCSFGMTSVWLSNVNVHIRCEFSNNHFALRSA